MNLSKIPKGSSPLFLVYIFAFSLFTRSANSFQTIDENSFVPGEFLLQVKPEKRLALQKFFKNQKMKSKKINESTLLLKFNSKSRESFQADVLNVVTNLKSLAGVEIVEPNYIYHISQAPNDPMYSQLWGLHNSGQTDSSGSVGIKGVDINVENAWNLSTGSKDVVIAVIDTGVDFKIPDLNENAWTNLPEAKGLPQVDDDSNGYIDDIHGFNFVADNGDATDDNGHGSHCSGTIGAKGNDKYGVAGINWDTRIMAVKFIAHDGTGTLANAVKAIDYARKNGARIMSNSWGGSSDSQILKQAIEEAEKSGILFVAAAGNDGTDNDKSAFYPASYQLDNIISVAALNNRARLSNFSNFGRSTTHIAAPGEYILSTTPKGFETLSGTSMATPHVSGVAALLLSYDPQLNFRELKARILDNARPLFRLKNKISSGGMLDAFATLMNIKPGPDENDPALLKNHEASLLASPHPYANSVDQTFKITKPGAKKIAIHFARFETEPNYDFVEVLDANGKSYDKMSGYHNDQYSEIVEGDSIILHMTSDKSINGYGFDIDETLFE